jgi:hypothetical protein
MFTDWSIAVASARQPIDENSFWAMVSDMTGMPVEEIC